MARDLKFRIKEVDGLYYPCSENKDADQLRGNREADLHLCFRNMQKSGFSHVAGHIRTWNEPSHDKTGRANWLFTAEIYYKSQARSKLSNDQELVLSESVFCPENQITNRLIKKE